MTINNRWDSIYIIIEDFPYCLYTGYPYFPAPQGYEIVKYGMGYHYGDINPLTGTVLKYGDYVPLGTTGKKDVIIGISKLNFQNSISKRIPNIQMMELTCKEASLINGYDLKGKIFTLYYYNDKDMIAENFLNGFVENVKYEENDKFILTLQGYSQKLYQEIFGQPESKLVADITNSQTSITLDDATYFPQSGLIIIGNELISYTGKDTNTLTGCNRGSYNSDAVEHRKNSKVNFVIYKNNKITLQQLLLEILTSTGEGTNGEYDVLPKGCGLGIETVYIYNYPNSILNYTNPATLTYPNLTWDFFFYEKKPAEEILNAILVLLNAQLIYSMGKFKLLPDTNNGTSTVQFFDYITRENTDVINLVEWIYNVDIFGSIKLLSCKHANNFSIQKEGEKKLEIYLPCKNFSKVPYYKNYDDPLDEEVDEKYTYYHEAMNYFLGRYSTSRKMIDTIISFNDYSVGQGYCISYNNTNYMLTEKTYDFEKYNISIKGVEQ